MIFKRWLKLIGFFLLAVLPVVTVNGNSEGATPALPLKVPDATWRPLQQRQDQRLQLKLDQALEKHQLWQSLIAEEKMAVGLVDLSDPLQPRFAQVNGNTMMYAASLPKIAILLAAHHSFEDGSLKETPQIKADLVEMIRRSSNPAASQMAARIGLKKIEEIIRRYQFYDEKQGGGIWMGGYFARADDENPDPLKNLLYAATVNQVCRFYYLLAYGKLINPARSRQMLKILAFPDLDDKFVTVLKNEVPLQRLYRKSGEFKGSYSDSILVWGEKTWQRYILTAIVEHPQGEQIMRKLVPAAEEMLKPQRSPHKKLLSIINSRTLQKLTGEYNFLFKKSKLQGVDFIFWDGEKTKKLSSIRKPKKKSGPKAAFC